MTMQDRVYAAAIFIVIGVMCIGIYVAISGFLNSNPNGLPKLPFQGEDTTPTALAGVRVEIPTETAAPPTKSPLPTKPPTKTPKGFVASPTPAATRPPTLDLPTVPTEEPVTPTPAATFTPQGCGMEFCPRLGPPDASGPGGNPCHPNYIWGRVLDRNRQGMPDVKVAFHDNSGNAGQTVSKSAPDTGKYDIPLGNGTWIVEIVGRKEAMLSPSFAVVVGQPWSGAGTCPTHVDFVQQ